MCILRLALEVVEEAVALTDRLKCLSGSGCLTRSTGSGLLVALFVERLFLLLAPQRAMDCINGIL